jgi:hypothetical protein
MASIISAGTTSGTALNMSGDTSGVLQLATNGTTTALTLDASQNATFAGTLTTTGITNSGVATATRFNPTGSSVTGNGMYLPAANSVGFSTSSAERMRIDSSGNVGINTSSPSTYVNGYNNSLVVGDGTNWATIQGRTDGPSGAGNGVSYGGSYGTFPINGARMFIGATSAGQRGIITFNTKDLDDNTTQPLERMRIDSSGYVRINNTSNATFAAQLNIYSPSTNNCAIHCRTNTSGTQSQIIFGNSTNDSVGGITTNGSSTAYNTSSDYRLKENIVPMMGALATVAQLKPVTYKWKTDGSNGQGFIAHELQAVVPDCVTGEKDAVETYTDEDGNEQTYPKYQGIDTSFLVATLTAAIQELKSINDTQAETINALTARIVALEQA